VSYRPPDRYSCYVLSRAWHWWFARIRLRRFWRLRLVATGVVLAGLFWGGFWGGPHQVLWVALLLILVDMLVFTRSDLRADKQAAANEAAQRVAAGH
jgi:hypothetical protein